jgi:hypothetical protein
VRFCCLLPLPIKTKVASFLDLRVREPPPLRRTAIAVTRLSLRSHRARVHVAWICAEGLQEEMLRVLAENNTLRRERASLATELEDWRAEQDFLSLLSPPPPPPPPRTPRTPHMSHGPRAPPSPALPTPRTASPQPRQWCDPLTLIRSHPQVQSRWSTGATLWETKELKQRCGVC